MSLNSQLPIRRSRRSHVVLASLGACLALLAAVAGAPTTDAQGADTVLRDFEPTSELVLVLDGKKIEGAEIYFSRRAGGHLVNASALASPVFLNHRTGMVQSVNLMKMVPQDDGSVDLLADPFSGNQGRYAMQGTEITFQVAGKSAKLAVKPPLTGLRTAAELLEHSPDYASRGASYTPDSAALTALQQQSKSVTVRVFFGSWCSHCKEHLPHLLKVEERLADSSIDFEYYGLPQPPEAWQDAEVKKSKVTGVPTGIVYVDGREVGRITTNDWRKPEAALRNIVGQGSGS